MSWGASDVIEIYIGKFSGGWALNGQSQTWSSHADPLAGLERLVAEVEACHASRWRKARVDLWLSGGLARPFVCGPIAGLDGWREAAAFAAAGAADATGLEGPCRVHLEDWPGDGPTVATALDTALAEAIDTFARSRRIAWRSVRPRWAAALDELLAQRASAMLFALAEEDALTLLCGSRDTGAAASNLQLASTYAPSPDSGQAQALWHRVMLSHDVRPDEAWFGRLEFSPQPESFAATGAERFPGWPGVAREAEGTGS